MLLIFTRFDTLDKNFLQSIHHINIIPLKEKTVEEILLQATISPGLNAGSIEVPLTVKR